MHNYVATLLDFVLISPPRCGSFRAGGLVPRFCAMSHSSRHRLYYDLRDLLAVLDRAYVLHEGRLIFSGKPARLLSDALVRNLDLGDGFLV